MDMSLDECATPALVKPSVHAGPQSASVGYELPGLVAGHPPVRTIAGAPDDESIAAIVETLARRASELAADRRRGSRLDHPRRGSASADGADDSRQRSCRALLSDLPPLAGAVLAVLAAAIAEHRPVAPCLTLGALERVAAELLGSHRCAAPAGCAGRRRRSRSTPRRSSAAAGFVVAMTPDEFVHRAGTWA